MIGASTWRTLEAARSGNAGPRLTDPVPTMNWNVQNALNCPSQGQTNDHADCDENKLNPYRAALTIISINIEGLSSTKAEILAYLCKKTACDILCVQETHRGANQPRPNISGMILIAEIPHEKYGSAMFANPAINIDSTSVSTQNNIEIITAYFQNCTITSIYKPPKYPFSPIDLRIAGHSAHIIIGDFNSHSSSWGYSTTNADGEAVEAWAEAKNFTLLHDVKLPASFNSRTWHRGYNPDLIFTSQNISSLCKKRVHDPIPHTQHRPISCQIQAAISPVVVPFRRRFNFRKANWRDFSEYVESKLTNVEPIPQNYDLFVDIIWKSARKHIPRGCRCLYIPGLEDRSAELLSTYESLYTKDPFSEKTILAGEELMQAIAESRKNSWVQLVSSIDMTHNSKKAWHTIKKLTGDLPNATNTGQVTANQVAHQLLLNGKPPHRLPREVKPQPHLTYRQYRCHQQTLCTSRNSSMY